MQKLALVLLPPPHSWRAGSSRLLQQVWGQCLFLPCPDVSWLPSQATCALHEILSAPECGPAVVGLYAELFVTLLLRVSCMVGVQLPKNMQSKERKSISRGPPPKALDPCRYCSMESKHRGLCRGGGEGGEGARPTCHVELIGCCWECVRVRVILPSRNTQLQV